MFESVGWGDKAISDGLGGELLGFGFWVEIYILVRSSRMIREYDVGWLIGWL